MTVLIDTSAFSVFGRGGDSRLVPWFSAEHQLLMPLIVVGELRAGFAAGSKRQANEKLFRQFLDAPNVGTLTISDATTIIYAEIYRKLRAAGTPIGTNDMWIAAMTIERDAELLTLDPDFKSVHDLRLASI